MVSDATRNAVWDEFWQATRSVRYCEALYNRYQRRHDVIMFILAISIVSGIVTLLGLLPDAIQTYVNAGVSIAAAWSLVFRDAKKASVIYSLLLECSRIRGEYRALWLEIENNMKSDEETLQKLRELSDALQNAKHAAGDQGISEDRRINIKSAEGANRVMENQYKTA